MGSAQRPGRVGAGSAEWDAPGPPGGSGVAVKSVIDPVWSETPRAGRASVRGEPTQPTLHPRSAILASTLGGGGGRIPPHSAPHPYAPTRGPGPGSCEPGRAPGSGAPCKRGASGRGRGPRAGSFVWTEEDARFLSVPVFSPSVLKAVTASGKYPGPGRGGRQPPLPGEGAPGRRRECGRGPEDAGEGRQGRGRGRGGRLGAGQGGPGNAVRLLLRFARSLCPASSTIRAAEAGAREAGPGRVPARAARLSGSREPPARAAPGASLGNARAGGADGGCPAGPEETLKVAGREGRARGHLTPGAHLGGAGPMRGGGRGPGRGRWGRVRSARSRGCGDAGGRGRAPREASPCPSPRGGGIAERRGSAPPWCSSDSCTNPGGRIKRKGKPRRRRRPLPSALLLQSGFLWGGLFGWVFGSVLVCKKPPLQVPSRGASSELRPRPWLVRGAWAGPCGNRRTAGRAHRGGSLTEGPQVRRPQTLPLQTAAPFPKPAAADAIDPARAAPCAGVAICFSATWLSPRGACLAEIRLLCARCRQARSKFGGGSLLTHPLAPPPWGDFASSPFWCLFFRLLLDVENSFL